MRLRRFLVIAILTAAIGASAYRFGDALLAFASGNMPLFIAGSVGAAAVLAATVILLGFDLKRQRTLLREARRVAVLNSVPMQPPAVAPGASDARQDAADPPNPALLSLLGTLEEVDARRSGDREPAMRAATRLEPHLHYQPVIALADGSVAGYDVYRKVHLRDLVAEPRFVQTAMSDDPARRAHFELSVIETALAAARQVFSAAEPAQGGMLYVHVGDALLDHGPDWTKLALLLSAHPALRAQVTLCIADQALVDPPQARLDAIDRMLDADAGLGVSGLDFSPQALPDYMARALQIAMYAHARLQDGESGAAAKRASCLRRLIALGVPACPRGLASDADIVDALQSGATLGSGPVFAEPMRLRDEPMTAGRSDDRAAP